VSTAAWSAAGQAGQFGQLAGQQLVSLVRVVSLQSALCRHSTRDSRRQMTSL